MPGTVVQRMLAVAAAGRPLRIYPTLDDALAGASAPPGPGDVALRSLLPAGAKGG